MSALLLLSAAGRDSPLYYALPEAPTRPLWRRGIALSALAGLHAFLLTVGFGAAVRPDLAERLQTLTVRMLEMAPARPEVEPPKPPPESPRRKSPVPLPLLTAAATASAAADFAVTPQPEPRYLDAALASSAPTPIVPARFDADYLQNPAPAYPSASRRLGEEGRVVLRVKVSAQGLPQAVEIRQSSGHARLDEAARAAVEKWRFVPARQGSETIESWVLVPLRFALKQ
jgi:protein TonB